MSEEGNSTNVTEPADNVEVSPRRRKDPSVDSKVSNTKKIRRLTLKLEEIERER